MIIKAESDKIMYLLSDENHSNCLAIRVIMKDDVDEGMLQQAVDITMKRYSYLNVRFVEKIRPFYVENNAPYKVMRTRRIDTIGGPETDYHLIVFTYYDKTIRICFSHALVDGGGIYGIIRTLVYYYARLRYDRQLSPEGIITLETPVNKDEMVDPFMAVKAFKSQSAEKKKKRKVNTADRSFLFADSDLIKHDTEISEIIYIKVPADKVMKVCKANEISPAILTALLVANSIRRLHPCTGDITCGMSMSIRNVIDCKETLRNSIVPATITFPSKMSGLPFDVQCTACRGQVILATDENILIRAAIKLSKMADIVKKLPYTKATRKIMGVMGRAIMHETFQVSYIGQSRMEAAEQYVDSVMIDYDMPTEGISVEMTSVGNNMILCFGQKWSEDVYLNSFIDELHNLDIDTKIIERSAPNVPLLYSEL